ncbi:MAG: hypothetical protein ACKO9Q_30895 [Pirellula sp.]
MNIEQPHHARSLVSRQATALQAMAVQTRFAHNPTKGPTNLIDDG